MTNKPLYIFDIDGTLALIDHRLSHLQEKENPDRWKEFYKSCDKDKPNFPVISVMNRLIVSGADVWLFTGRSEEVRDKTIAWLAQHTAFMSFNLQTDHLLTMRQEGDYTPDDQLKESWLDNMLVDDRQRLVGVFDDRQRVVDMWRRNGVACFQVAPGGF